MKTTSSLIPDGIWPVMLTAFREDQSLDWSGVEALTEFYLGAGVSGLFAVAQSAEMFELTAAERVELARRVVTQVDGRVPVVSAGAFGSSFTEQIDLVHQLADVGVSAVVLLTNQMATESESEDVWRRGAEAILSETDDIPLGLYECPSPYKRILSTDLYKWAAETNRFVFYKDTCLSLSQIKSKIDAAAHTPLKFFNAELNSLSASLVAGGNGFSGIAANFYPELLVWLWQNAHEHPGKANSLQKFLSIAEAVADYKYPTSAKYFLRETGRVNISNTCRIQNVAISEHEQRTLTALAEYLPHFSNLGND